MNSSYNSTFQIHDSFLARIAAAPYEHYTRRTLQAWLDDPLFLNALLLASDNLYSELQKVNFKIDQVPFAARRSVRKYINRMTSRTVPFGAFAGFVLAQFNTESMKLEEDFTLHLQNDFGNLLAGYREQFNNAHNHAYQANPTLYHISAATRFIATQISNVGSTTFSLHTLPKNGLLRDLTAYCREKRSVENIVQFLYVTGLNRHESLLFLDELVKEQILLPETYPLVTVDHPEGYRLSRQHLIENGTDQKNQHSLPRQRWYANLELQCSGGIPHFIKNDLKDVLYALRRVCTTGELSELNTFKEDFVRRFGERSVPLMEALDPEIGITYAGLSKTTRGMALLDGIDLAQTPNPPTHIPWGTVHQIILNKWPQRPGASITLADSDLIALQENTDKLPPSLSMLFRYEEGKVWLDSCGGASALQIAGRFSSLNSGVKNVLKDIASQEELANQDILFAEIVSFSEGRTDNVNRRAILRRYEIPVTAGSSLPPEQQIWPSSLMVAVVNNEIILWSPGLGKRVIPRLSSAYNYHRCTLPLLRFLGDLQYQGIQHQWSADLTLLFPGLKWYPRLTYRNTILSPATWVLDAVELKKATNGGPEAFKALAESLHLPWHVALGDGDRYLRLNLYSKEDLVLLAGEIPSEGQVVLRELPVLNHTDGTVTSETGQTHAAQFNAFVITAAPVYSSDILFPAPTPQQIVLPGRPWLYYKLYMPAASSDRFLSKLSPVISLLLKEGYICEWFYVRYLDPGPHLRLRLKISEYGLEATTRTLSALFEKVIRSGQLHRMTLETYEPENIRYVDLGMPLTESIFTASSNFVLAASREAGFQHHIFAIRSTYDSLKQLIPDNLKRLKLMGNIRDQLLKETSYEDGFKKGLERKKRDMRTITTLAIEKKDPYRSLRCKQAANRYLYLLSSLQDKNVNHLQVCADLCHMHVNRCFPADMRRQELVLYTLLHQYELTVLKKITF